MSRQCYCEVLGEIPNLCILESESAEAAIELLNHHRIDIFLLDVELPGMDGFTLARRIREIPAYMLSPILFVTGHSRNPMRIFREVHCYDYIVKPFSLKELRAKVEDLLVRLEWMKNIEPKKPQRLVPFETESELFLLPVERIRFLEAHHGGCRIHLDNQELWTPRMSISEVIWSVDEWFVVQCYRSFAVNVKHIQAIEKINYRLWRIHMQGGECAIDMSIKYKTAVETAV